MHLVPGRRAGNVTREFRRRGRVLSVPGDEDVAILRPPVGLATLMVGDQEVSVMNTPGFTAHNSLYQSNRHYLAGLISSWSPSATVVPLFRAAFKFPQGGGGRLSRDVWPMFEQLHEIVYQYMLWRSTALRKGMLRFDRDLLRWRLHQHPFELGELWRLRPWLSKRAGLQSWRVRLPIRNDAVQWEVYPSGL